MHLDEQKLIKSKENQKRTKQWNVFAFLISDAYIFLYQIILIKIQAPYPVIADLGIIFNSFFLAVATGYIFYYLTYALPKKTERGKMGPIIISYQGDLAKQLELLIILLTSVKDWTNYSDSDLKEKMREYSKSRTIWMEEYQGIYKDENGCLLLRPTIIQMISYTVDNIKAIIDDIINNGIYFEDINYIKRIVWLRNSIVMKRLKMCKEAAKIQDNEEVPKNDTYLDSVFKDELPILLFSNNQDEGMVFIEEIRKLIKYNEKW